MASKSKSEAASEKRVAEVAEAAVVFLRAYTEKGTIGKRGAIQSEAWKRLQAAVNLNRDAAMEAKCDQRRKVKAAERQRNHPYSQASVRKWFWDRVQELADGSDVTLAKEK